MKKIIFSLSCFLFVFFLFSFDSSAKGTSVSVVSSPTSSSVSAASDIPVFWFLSWNGNSGSIAYIFAFSTDSNFSVTFSSSSGTVVRSSVLQTSGPFKGYYGISEFSVSNIVSSDGFDSVNDWSDNTPYIWINYMKNYKDPIIDSLDASLGSFVLANRQNAWTNTIYGRQDFTGKLRTAVQGTTTTGKTVGTDFDSFQYYTGVGNCHSSGIFSKNYGSFVESSIHQAKLDTPTRGGYSMVFTAPDDFKDSLIQFYNSASGSATQSVQQFFNEIVKGGNSLSFKPIVYVRPYDSSSGRYGNWLRIVSGDVNSSSLSNGGSSGSGESQVGDSSDDPSSTSFNNPSGLETNTGVTSTGSTEENALNNALTIQNNISVNPDINVNVNNNISNELQDIGNSSSSSGGVAAGNVLSNLVGLLGLVGAVPQMIGVLFSWLPSWVLVIFGVGFALLVPVLIFKLIRG